MAAEQPYFLHTVRLGFRCWTAEDLPLAVALWADPTVTRLVADLGQPSVEQARQRLSREMTNLNTFGVQYWPIFLLDDGRHVGCCGLRPYQVDNGIFELGAHLLPAFWKHGYATEATRGVVQHARGQFRIQSLFARHNPHNHGSVRILEKLGFQYTHDEFMPQTGLHHPCYLLQLRSADCAGKE